MIKKIIIGVIPVAIVSFILMMISLFIMYKSNNQKISHMTWIIFEILFIIFGISCVVAGLLEVLVKVEILKIL